MIDQVSLAVWEVLEAGDDESWVVANPDFAKEVSMMKKPFLSLLPVGLFCLIPIVSNALTPEQVIQLKKSGVEEKTIQLMIAQEIAAADRNPYDTLGTREIKDAGGNAVIIYSTGRPAGGELDREEQEKLDRAWEMLQNITIETK